MAVRSIDEIMTSIRARVGDDTSDETLAFVEDVSDTMNSLADAEHWRQEYERNDAEWRVKYRDRFFNPDKPEAPEDKSPEEEKAQLTFENLFKEE